MHYILFNDDEETQVWSLGWEDPLEKEITTRSSVLPWRIPWTQWATVHEVTKSWTTAKQNIYWEILRILNPSKTWTAAAAKLLQLCPTLCNPIDGSPPGSPVPGILQARTLEWAAISFSSAWKWKVKVKSLSHVRLLATPWTAAYQAPPSMEFSRQEYWSGVPIPSPKHGLLVVYSYCQDCVCVVLRIQKRHLGSSKSLLILLKEK